MVDERDDDVDQRSDDEGEGRGHQRYHQRTSCFPGSIKGNEDEQKMQSKVDEVKVDELGLHDYRAVGPLLPLEIVRESKVFRLGYCNSKLRNESNPHPDSDLNKQQ